MAKIPQSFFRRQGGAPQSARTQAQQIQGDPGAAAASEAAQQANAGRIDLSPVASGLSSIGQVFKQMQTEKNELAKIKQQSAARTLIIQTRADLVQAHQEVQALELDDPDQVKQELYTRANGLIEKYGPQLEQIGPYANEPFNQVMQSTMMNMIPELTGKAIQRSQVMLNNQLDDQTQASLNLVREATNDADRDAALNDGLDAIDALRGVTISDFKAEQLRERFIFDAVKAGLSTKILQNPTQIRQHLAWLTQQEGISEDDKAKIRQSVMADISQQNAFAEHQDSVLAAQRKAQKVETYQGILGDAVKAVKENDFDQIDKLFAGVHELNKNGQLTPEHGRALLTYLEKAASGDEREPFSDPDSPASKLRTAIKLRDVTASQAETALRLIAEDVNAKEYRMLVDEISNIQNKAETRSDKLERDLTKQVRDRLESYREMTMSQAAKPGGAAQFKQQTEQLMQRVLPILEAEVDAALNAGDGKGKGDNWPELARRMPDIVDKMDRIFGEHFKDPTKNAPKPLDHQDVVRYTQQNAYGDSPMSLTQRGRLWIEDKRRRESDPNYSPDKDPVRIAAQERAAQQQERYQAFLGSLLGGPSRQAPEPQQPQAAGEAAIDPQSFQGLAQQLAQGEPQEAPALPQVPQSVIDSLPAEFRTAVDPADIPGAQGAPGAGMTPEGIKHLEQFEGRRNLPYDDATGKTLKDVTKAQGFPTIGIGHLLTTDEIESGTVEINGEQVPYLDGLSDEHIDALLQDDMHDAAAAVDRYVTVPITPQERDALISFAFNIGTGAFRKAGAIAALNRGDREEFLRRHAQWNKSKGKVMEGLNNRRAAEAKLFSSNA